MLDRPEIRDADLVVDGDAVWSALEPVLRRADTDAIDADVGGPDADVMHRSH